MDPPRRAPRTPPVRPAAPGPALHAAPRLRCDDRPSSAPPRAATAAAAAAPRRALGLAPGATYVLHNACSGRVLDVFGQATADGAAVGQWAANGGANQHWKVTDLGTGYAKLNPMHAPVKALDVTGAGTADGTPVQIWAENGSCAQQWQFEAVGGTPAPAPGPSATRLIGIYTGAGGNAWNAGAGDDPDSWYRGFQLAEQGLGHPITALTHFPSWGGYSWWAYHVRETVRESTARRPGLVPLIALKLIGAGDEGIAWQDAGEMANVAAGGRDHVWTGVVDSLAALHVPLSVIRVGYEDNDNFMNDGYGYDAATRRAYWANGEGGWGLDQHVALVKKLGKGVLFFEHGSTLNSAGPAHGLANDSVFWNYSAQRIRDMRVQGVPFYGSAFWDVNPSDAPGAAFTQGQQPAVLAAIQQNFDTFVGDDLSGLIAARTSGSTTALERTPNRAVSASQARSR